MEIQGVQVIYRLRSTIRLFIDYRQNVDSFNLYYSNIKGGPYIFLNFVTNVVSKSPATRGKIIFEFNTDSLGGWDNDSRNYIKLSEVIGGIEGVLEGPLTILTRLESVVPKEFSVMYGLNKDLQKFIPISVDENGKVMTI